MFGHVCSEPGVGIEVPFSNDEWPLRKRLVFRFLFVYLALFAISTQLFPILLGIAGEYTPDLATITPLRQIVAWVGQHVLGMDASSVAPRYEGSDTPFHWALLFCIVVAAAVACLIWSIVDSKRSDYSTLYRWSRLALRFLLAGQMLSYGLMKVFPSQMPFPPLTTLVSPFGNNTLTGMLWVSVGSSPAYTIATGIAETLGGLLLLVPRTATLGALVCMVEMFQVFLLNVTYDVSVKVVSLHLFLLAVIILLPDMNRIISATLSLGIVRSNSQTELFSSRRANHVAQAAQLAFAGWIAIPLVVLSWSEWHREGSVRTKPPLYGIWTIESYSVGGLDRPPLLTDRTRWHRIIFDVHGEIDFQLMDSSIHTSSAVVDMTTRSIELADPATAFHFERPAEDFLILKSDTGARTVVIELKRMDLNSIPLVGGGFHLIQE